MMPCSVGGFQTKCHAFHLGDHEHVAACTHVRARTLLVRSDLPEPHKAGLARIEPEARNPADGFEPVGVCEARSVATMICLCNALVRGFCSRRRHSLGGAHKQDLYFRGLHTRKTSGVLDKAEKIG